MQGKPVVVVSDNILYLPKINFHYPSIPASFQLTH